MDTIIIRPATTKDFKAIQKLSTELAHSDIPFDKQIDLNWAHTDSGKKYYKSKITHNQCTVAELNRAVIGYSTYAIKEVPTWRLVKVAELENLFVTAEYRRKRVGQMLMDQFITWAKQQRAHKIAVSVFSPNEGAVRFYKRHGLREYDMNLEMSL